MLSEYISVEVTFERFFELTVDDTVRWQWEDYRINAEDPNIGLETYVRWLFWADTDEIWLLKELNDRCEQFNRELRWHEVYTDFEQRPYDPDSFDVTAWVTEEAPDEYSGWFQDEKLMVNEFLENLADEYGFGTYWREY